MSLYFTRSKSTNSRHSKLLEKIVVSEMSTWHFFDCSFIVPSESRRPAARKAPENLPPVRGDITSSVSPCTPVLREIWDVVGLRGNECGIESIILNNMCKSSGSGVGLWMRRIPHTLMTQYYWVGFLQSKNLILSSSLDKPYLKRDNN